MIGAKGSSDGPRVEVVKARPRKRPCLDPGEMALLILRGLKRQGCPPGSIAAITARLPASRTSAQRALARIEEDEAA
jgi:hypothetical protein